MTTSIRRVRSSAVPVLLYAAFIVYQSVAGGGAWVCDNRMLEWPQRLSRIDVLANVVAYVPLGWLCAVAMTADVRRRSTARLALLLISATLGSGLSLVLEAVQSCQAGRVSSAIDWVANSAGAVLGVVLALLLPTLAHAIEPSGAARTHESSAGARLRVVATAVVVSWVLAQAMPWSFTVDIGTWRHNLAFLRHWRDAVPLDGWHALRHFGAWLAIVAACRVGAPRRHAAAAWLLLAVTACLTLQVMLAAPSPLSFEELAGMAAALVVSMPFLLLATEDLEPIWWARLLIAGVVLVVAAYELRPAPGTTHPFRWLPQVGLGGRLGALDFAGLFAWVGCGVVVAAHAARRQHDRARAWRWPIAMIVLVLALEALQTRIPGRGPDTSPVLFTTLAMLGTGVLLRDGR